MIIIKEVGWSGGGRGWINPPAIDLIGLYSNAGPEKQARLKQIEHNT